MPKAAPADAEVPDFHRTVLDGLPEAVVVAAPDGAVTFVNAALSALLGYAADEVVGRPITMLVPPQEGRRLDAVKWLARWAAEPDVEQSRFLDLAARRKDGAELMVQVRVRAGEIGGQPRYFISVRDDTARRREQIALKDANLRAARILMLAEDGIVTIDAGQKIIFFNQAAERMFGYSAEAVLGEPLDRLLPPASRGVHAGLVARFGRSKEASRMMGERARVQGQRRDGRLFPIEATITQVNLGGVLTYTAHLRDISRRRSAGD